MLHCSLYTQEREFREREIKEGEREIKKREREGRAREIKEGGERENIVIECDRKELGVLPYLVNFRPFSPNDTPNQLQGLD